MGKSDRHRKDWEPTKLQAIIDARSLANYTTHIISNQKVFNPENDWSCSTLALINMTARGIYLKAWSANRTDARAGKDMLDERMKLQIQAIRACGDLLAIIEMAWSQFHLPSKKVYNWASMTINVENQLKAWHRSDVERYKNSFKQI